jgi:hypothetical protein
MLDDARENMKRASYEISDSDGDGITIATRLSRFARY